MTKRFTYVKNNSITQYQALPIQEIGKGKALHCQGIVDKLNKLSDENEQLKKEYNSLQRTAYKIDAIAYEDREYSERLFKQNQQLEKENKELKQFKKSVFALINEKITFVNECEKNHNDIGIPYEYYLGADEILNLLKKELIE